MTIFTGEYKPYQYDDKRQALCHVIQSCMNIKKSIRLMEKDTEHLTLRCPVSGDYIDIVGEPSELDWLNNELRKGKWYREA